MAIRGKDFMAEGYKLQIQTSIKQYKEKTNMKSKLLILVSLLAVIAILSSCTAPVQPTPATIIQTVEVPKTVIQTVEVPKTVIQTVEVQAQPTKVTLPFEGVELNILTFTGPQIAE